MNPTLAALAAAYTEWLDLIRSMLPGARPAPLLLAPDKVLLKPLTPRAEQAAANQEWEQEGGSVKPPESKISV